jgi:cellobiose phosphorylase
MKKSRHSVREAQGEFGEFLPDGRSYRIKRPDTPRPWFNYVGNDRLLSIVSQTGGGFAAVDDCKLHRLTRYDGVLSDRPGRYVYLSDFDSGDLWSAGWQPVRAPLDEFECLVEPGVSTIRSRRKEIEATLVFSSALEAPAELWTLAIVNRGRKTRRLRLCAFVDWLLGDFSLETLYENILVLYNRGRRIRPGLLAAGKLPTSTRPATGWGAFGWTLAGGEGCLRAEEFFGGYGDSARPAFAVHPVLSRDPLVGERMVAALAKNVILPAGSRIDISVVQAWGSDEKRAIRLAERFLDGDSAVLEIEKKRKESRRRLDGHRLESPNERLDRFVSHWVPLQLMHITSWRSACPYSHGDGGRGFRDTTQDVSGAILLSPRKSPGGAQSMGEGLALRHLETLFGFQHARGSAVSGFSSIDGPWETAGKSGVVGKSDVALWLSLATGAFVRETGNADFLRRELPFLDGGPAPILEHLRRAVAWTAGHTGEHGLPLIGRADWNDALDRVGVEGRGESVWLAQMLVASARETAILARLVGEEAVGREMDDVVESFSRLVNEEGWSGKWYLRAVTDSGRWIGGPEGRMFLNTQSWAILSGIADAARSRIIRKEVDARLRTPWGYALFAPWYERYDPEIGRITAFAPGTKENAAVFSHATAFMAAAHVAAGNVDAALRDLESLLPDSFEKPTRQYRAEPYVLAEYVVGPGHPTACGRGEFTWNTGTAPWFLRIAIEGLLGIRAEVDGLLVRPTLPSRWNNAVLERWFRGCLHRFEITRRGGIPGILLDGELLSESGRLLPVGNRRKRLVRIEVPAAESPARARKKS